MFLATLFIAAVLGAHELPPERYRDDAAPTIVFIDDTYRLSQLCSRLLGRRGNWVACQTGSVIYMPNPCNRRDYSDIYSATLCHELGHINGWIH